MKEDNQVPSKAVSLSPSLFVKQLLTFAMGKLFFLAGPTPTVQSRKEAAEFL